MFMSLAGVSLVNGGLFYASLVLSTSCKNCNSTFQGLFLLFTALLASLHFPCLVCINWFGVTSKKVANLASKLKHTKNPLLIYLAQTRIKYTKSSMHTTTINLIIQLFLMYNHKPRIHQPFSDKNLNKKREYIYLQGFDKSKIYIYIYIYIIYIYMQAKS